MMISVRDAHYEKDFQIRLLFNTGEEGVVDLSDLIQKYKVAAPLRDPLVFSKFHLDGWPTLSWDCGFDVAPETLYQRATGKQVAWLQAH
jgi:Protein of unknown function (DUF2442)